MEKPDTVAEAFSRVPERNTGDVLLRTAQQHHVALSSMADTKANIIITVSSIVLTLSLGRIGDPELRPAVQTLAIFTLISLFFAILAVLPKHRTVRVGEGAFPSDFNLLFFGHFAADANGADGHRTQGIEHDDQRKNRFLDCFDSW